MSDPRIVVITGAASGIGHATAELFRDLGDTVFGLDISPTVPDGVTYVECNVGDKAAVDAAIATCAAGGRIDVLANVAGIVQFGRFEGISEEEYDRVQAVDLKGPFFLIQAALPHIRAAKGNIVNVSSVAGNKAQGYSAAYSAAKGGLTMLTRALALELAPEGIRVNAVCPGAILTPMVEATMAAQPDPAAAERTFLARYALGRFGTAAEVAGAVLYLTSAEASYVTGSALGVDGGSAWH